MCLALQQLQYPGYTRYRNSVGTDTVHLDWNATKEQLGDLLMPLDTSI
jgi:hypothetical protein